MTMVRISLSSTRLLLRAGRFVLLLLVVLAVSGSSASAAVISVFGEVFGYSEAYDTEPGSLTAYVYHRDLEGKTASMFRIVPGGGFTGVFASVAFDPMYIAVGDIADGIMVSYGTCMGDVNLLVASVTYTTFGTSPSCSYLEVLPHPDSGMVETVGCDFIAQPANATDPLIINPDGTCTVTSTEATTWSRVKALYR